MKTAIFFYTGTGNSLWSARYLAQQLGETDLFPMALSKELEEILIDEVYGRLGLVFPVHIWGLPHPVLHFIHRLSPIQNKYLFACAVNAGQVANTLVQLRKVMARRALRLDSGFSVVLPSNYLPWGEAVSAGPKRDRVFAAARAKLQEASQVIRTQTPRPVEKGPLWQNILFSGIYRMSLAQVPKMDKDFWADEKCNGCKICAQICPARNVVLRGGRPVWRHRCEQCLACMQWCPQQSIQFGKKTPQYKRYHHPEVALKDMLACAPRN